MNAFVRVVVNVLVVGALLAAAQATAASAATSMTIPVHGTALAIPTRGTVVAVLDGIPAMYPSQTRRYRSTARFRPGETFDAYLDPRTATLKDVNAANEFVPGLPNHLVTHVMARGDQLPDYRFIAQNGRSMRFSDFRGKVLLLSFIYTRCPDLSVCPAISGKFAYLQHHLDPQHFQLVEMTLDPLADSPAVLAAYGRQFGADPAIWSLITGESAQVKNVLDSFALDPLETNPGRIIHSDTLVILGSDGKIADLIPTSGWEPDDVLATANDVAGLSSNPLRRFELATVAGVIAFCGGSLTTEIVLLDSLVFLLGVGILGGLLVWITKRVIIDERY
jgi:protein SCO1/2